VSWGSQRLLWGSDWPCTNHEAHADYPALHHALDDWLLDSAAAEAARVDNPAPPVLGRRHRQRGLTRRAAVTKPSSTKGELQRTIRQPPSTTDRAGSDIDPMDSPAA
jgi:hypothetical protein